MVQNPLKRFLTLIFAISFTSLGFAQYKYEREIRIKKLDVPLMAINFVDSMSLETKIRWYKEIGYHKTSYEAKTKYDGKRVSIEFSVNGVLEDIEIEITPKEIPSNTYGKIAELLTNSYDKYSIKKVQIQYSGNPQSILEYFLNRESKNKIDQNFEIVISTKINGTYTMFECLFDKSGELLQKSRIILKMMDNIEY